MTGTEEVLLHDWCQQFSSHSIGDLHFGADGMLYVTAGDGASFNVVDYGQLGTPVNPCADPPGGTMAPPTAEGGALRSQDVRTSADPTGLDGSLLRLDPLTGAAAAGNPAAASADPNTRRIIAHGLRNPYRFAMRPGTGEVWLGDVGWATWEEINRLTNPTARVTNFGWPCFEGTARHGGYDGANVNICEGLYTAGGQSGPHYAYQHTEKVVAGETCPSGGSSISGMAFYPTSGGDYPASYQGAVFFADYTRDCIWAMRPAAPGGVPDAANRQTFVAAASNPVDLAIGPGGDLYYADAAEHHQADPLLLRQPAAERGPRRGADHRARAADRRLRRRTVHRPGPGRRGPAALRVGLHRRRHRRRPDADRDVHLSARRAVHGAAAGAGHPRRGRHPDRRDPGRQHPAGGVRRRAGGRHHVRGRRHDLLRRARHRPRAGRPSRGGPALAAAAIPLLHPGQLPHPHGAGVERGRGGVVPGTGPRVSVVPGAGADRHRLRRAVGDEHPAHRPAHRRPDVQQQPARPAGGGGQHRADHAVHPHGDPGLAELGERRDPAERRHGTAYVYAAWSDAGAQTHVIVAPTTPKTYTATFVRQRLPQSQLKVRSVDSQETTGPPTNALDGNPATHWHTQWVAADPKHPHQITLDLGATYSVTGLSYLPRQNSTNGRIARYEVLVSTDGTNWGTPVAKGTWPNGTVEQTVTFAGKTGRYVRLRALSEVAGRAWTTAAELNVAVAQRVPRVTMKVRSADSQETVGENGRATNVLDGNTATYWHTQWQAAAPAHPHEIQLDLGRAGSVSCVYYRPRQNSANGRIADYEVYTSTDGTNWGTPAATGTWLNNTAEQNACFSARTARYIRLRALSEVAGKPWTSAAEIGVIGR
nr:hypothetical protein GCM10020092_046230 [Actinoplanes digitatis]